MSSRIHSFTCIHHDCLSGQLELHINFWFFSFCSEFGTKCSKCYRKIQATDWVRRARENVYHLACFACDTCQRQLSTGEEFALSGDQLLCLRHYTSLVEGDTDKGSSIFSPWKIWCLRVNFSHWHLKKSFDMYMYFSFKFLMKIKSIKVSSVLQLSIIEFYEQDLP